MIGDRAIRSFVRREGRITPAQRSALDTYSSRYGIELSDQPLDPVGLFGRHAPLHLEIGCGTGETLLDLAGLHPENDYLGVEVYRSGIGRLLIGVHQRRLHNVRIIDKDIVPILAQSIPDHMLDAVYIFFPDPWPKKRHHKRRLIQPAFVKTLQHKLRRHGRVFIATDWEDYARHIVQTFGSHGGFLNLAGSRRYAPRPRWRPVTRYERRAMRLGHTIREFVYGLG